MPTSSKEQLVCPGCGYYQPPERFSLDHVPMAATRVVSFGEGRGKGGIQWLKRTLTVEETTLLKSRLEAALAELERR